MAVCVCVWGGGELLRSVSVCARVPSGFVELSLVDQINLLKCCWLEILMLGLMWRSVDHPGKLIFSPDFKLNRWAQVGGDRPWLGRGGLT